MNVEDIKRINKEAIESVSGNNIYCLLAPIVSVLTFMYLKKMKFFTVEHDGVVDTDFIKISIVSILAGLLILMLK